MGTNEYTTYKKLRSTKVKKVDMVVLQINFLQVLENYTSSYFSF